MPYINKENRIFLSEESHEYGKIDILIDDDVRILNETKKF